jgi:PAS domain S-box-containing protein
LIGPTFARKDAAMPSFHPEALTTEDRLPPGGTGAPEVEPRHERREGTQRGLARFSPQSVRGRLVLLVAAITVPAVAWVALLTAQAYRNERRSVERHLIAATRALTSLFDRQVSEVETLLHGLAASAALEQEDFVSLDARARTVLGATAADRWVVLLDADGRKLVDTSAPPGTPLGGVEFEPEAREAALRHEIFVSDVILPTDGPPQFFVALPVFRGPELRFTLRLVMRSASLGRLLEVSRLSPGGVVSVTDRAGTIAARSREPERFVGRKMSATFAAAVAGHDEWVTESVTLDGIPVISAIAHSPRSGWMLLIAAPQAQLYATARGVLWLGLVLSGLLVGVAVMVASWIGRTLVRSVDLLVNDTIGIARGAIPPERSAGLEEMDFVSHAVRETALQLAEKERDNAALTSALQEELRKQRRADETSQRLAAIVESSDDAIIGKDLDGTITSWNMGAERILGYTAREIIGRPITELIPPERHDEERAILSGVRHNEPLSHLETVRRRKDGTLVEVALTVSPIIDRRGRVLGASTIARDITERKRSEERQQALYELVARVNRAEALPEIYSAALDALCRSQDTDRASILLTDADGVMRFKAWRALSEEYRRAAEGHSPWRRDDPNPAPVTIGDTTEATLETGLRHALLAEGIRALAFVPLMYEKRLLGKFMVYYDSPRSIGRNVLRPVETIASQVAFAIARQRAAEALEALVNERTASLRQVIEQMQEFSYSVSHDLRAPVRAMQGYASAVLEDHGHELSENGRELLRRILRSGTRMDRLIQDLLTYSRISRRELTLEPVSLDRLVREVVLQYPALHPEHADIEIASPLPDVIAHEPSLTQVVSNLLSNAVKFVAPGVRPHTRVHAELRESRARLWVEDNGIGIKPEYRSRLFRMFERVHPEQNYEGTGIGLAIVRKAVERMNGAAGFESDGVSGSRFWIELPLAQT